MCAVVCWLAEMLGQQQERGAGVKRVWQPDCDENLLITVTVCGRGTEVPEQVIVTVN